MSAVSLPLPRLSGLLFCWLAGCFELLAYGASDLLMPAMTGVIDELQASASAVPLSLACYLGGGVLAQWLGGPLSDDIGRRPVMLGGVLLFALASLALSTASEISTFLLLRAAQGSALGIVVAVVYPSIQEAFTQAQALRVTALLANIGLLSPLLAPLAGALLLTQLDWRDLFLYQGVMAALLALGLYLRMPETVGVVAPDGFLNERRRLSLAAILLDGRDLLQHRHFMACAVAIGLLGAPVVAWIALSPLLLMRNYGMDGMGYAQMQLPVFGALIAGNLALFRLAAHYALIRLLRLGTWPLAAGVMMAGASALLPATGMALALFVAGLSVYAFGIGLVNTTLYRLALYAPDSGAGVCAAMLGTITVVLFCLGGLLIESSGATHAPGCFGASMAVLGLLALAMLHVVRAQLQQAQHQTAAAQPGDVP